MGSYKYEEECASRLYPDILVSNLIHEQPARILYGNGIFAFGSKLEEDRAQFLSSLGKKVTFEPRHLQILFFHIGGRVSVQFLRETNLIRTHRFVGVPQ
jgi:hypothetical protein